MILLGEGDRKVASEGNLDSNEKVGEKRGLIGMSFFIMTSIIEIKNTFLTYCSELLTEV